MTKKARDWHAIIKDKVALLIFVALIAGGSIAFGMLTGVSPGSPSATLRDQARESAQMAKTTTAEYKKQIADGIINNSPSLSRADAECVADVIVNTHGVNGLNDLLVKGQTPYTPAVRSEMLSKCEVEL